MSNRLRVFALLTGFLLLTFPLELEARERFFGYCITDNTSITRNQRVHNKSCTIRVFDAGTVNLSTIFSDNTGTSKSNPFTAASTGFWFFYADDGRYDVQLSLGSPAIGSAFSWGDVLLQDGVKRTIESVIFSATPTFDASESDVFSMTLTANVTSSTITNPVIGKEITFLLSQDSTGGWTFAFPSDVVLRTGALLISSGVDEVTAVTFIYDGTNWQEVSYDPDEHGKDLTVNGSVTVNEAGNVTDSLRVETDTLANALCTDATNDRVGVGFTSTCTPSTRFEVFGGDITFDNGLDSTLTVDLISGATAAQGIDLRFGTFSDPDIGGFVFTNSSFAATGFNGTIFLSSTGAGTVLRPLQDNDPVTLSDATGNPMLTCLDVGVVGDCTITGDLTVDGVITGGLDDFNTVLLVDEFPTIAINGQLGWGFADIAGTGSIPNSSTNTFDHPGVLNLRSGATTSNASTIFLDTTTGGGLSMVGAIGSNADWDSTFIIKTDSGDITDVEYSIGFSDANNSATPSDQIIVSFITGTDTFWTFETCGTTTCTRTPSSITPTADTFFRFRIRSTTIGEILFSIDGGSETTLSTNVPTIVLGPFIMTKTLTSAVRDIFVDLFTYKATVVR